MEAVKVISPGPFTTVQDQGWSGFCSIGVPPCGMLDKWAGNLANLLVGNSLDSALLEFTFKGGRVEVLDQFCVSVTGGDMGLTINAEPAAAWRAHNVKPGDIIRLGQAQNGCRAYMALTGGIDVPLIMGSRSTLTGASIGGLSGRTLVKGDILRRCKGRLLAYTGKIPGEFIPEYRSKIVLRAVPGPQDQFFEAGSFFDVPFTISDKANRMGCRLLGPAVQRKPGMPKSIISEPSLPGGVQIPEDGRPIVLLNDQTMGGYAKAATVISSDIPRLAQAVPGNQVLFQSVTLEEAHDIYKKRETAFKGVRQAVSETGTHAAAGNDFFNSPQFCERIRSYMLQT